MLFRSALRSILNVMQIFEPKSHHVVVECLTRFDKAQVDVDILLMTDCGLNNGEITLSKRFKCVMSELNHIRDK